MSNYATRRKVLAFLGISASTFASTIINARSNNHRQQDILDVVIIGAGAAGLTAGFLLDQTKLSFSILEAADTFGGRAKKDTSLADFPIELGAEWVHTTKRVLNELSGTNHASERAIEWRPVTCDVWGNNHLTRQNRYARDWRGEQRFKSTTWFDFFNDYVAKNITHKIRLNSQVTTIDYRDEIVRVQTSDGKVIKANNVIVTVPLNVLKDGDIKFIPDMPAEKKRALNGVVMPDGFKLFIRFSEPFYPDLVLFDHGYKTPEAEIMFYNAALDKPTQQNILGMFGHGVVATPYTQMNEKQHLAAALNLLDQFYDDAASKNYQAHVLQNWSKSPFHRGTYSYYSSSSPADVGAAINNKIFFAGEAYNQRWDGDWGYMHTAARSAYDAVEEIIG